MPNVIITGATEAVPMKQPRFLPRSMDDVVRPNIVLFTPTLQNPVDPMAPKPPVYARFVLSLHGVQD